MYRWLIYWVWNLGRRIYVQNPESYPKNCYPNHRRLKHGSNSNRPSIDNTTNNWRNGKSRQQSRTLRISSNLLSGFLPETRSRLVALLYTISLSLPACPRPVLLLTYAMLCSAMEIFRIYSPRVLFLKWCKMFFTTSFRANQVFCRDFFIHLFLNVMTVIVLYNLYLTADFLAISFSDIILNQKEIDYRIGDPQIVSDSTFIEQVLTRWTFQINWNPRNRPLCNHLRILWTVMIKMFCSLKRSTEGGYKLHCCDKHIVTGISIKGLSFSEHVYSITKGKLMVALRLLSCSWEKYAKPRIFCYDTLYSFS